MSIQRKLLACASALWLVGLAGCQPTSNDDKDAEFFVASNGQGGVNGYTVQGWGWKPGDTVEVKIWHEPDGPGSALGEWKKLFDAKVDSTSLFGFSGSATFYPVRRWICGNPENGQFLLAMVKSTTTNRIRMRQVPVDIYFTFQPCG